MVLREILRRCIEGNPPDAGVLSPIHRGDKVVIVKKGYPVNFSDVLDRILRQELESRKQNRFVPGTNPWDELQEVLSWVKNGGILYRTPAGTYKARGIDLHPHHLATMFMFYWWLDEDKKVKVYLFPPIRLAPPITKGSETARVEYEQPVLW